MKNGSSDRPPPPSTDPQPPSAAVDAVAAFHEFARKSKEAFGRVSRSIDARDRQEVRDRAKMFSVAIEDLTADPANVRLHKRRNLEAIKGSLLRFGQQKPIVVDAQGVIVAGNGTLEAARELGWKELRVVVSDLEGTDRTAFAIADNRTAELAEWEKGGLASALDAVRCDMDTLACGFTAEEVERLVQQMRGPGAVDEDSVPAAGDQVITEPGDLWTLGDHRLLCGSCTNGEDVDRLMNGERAALFATDPPYLVEYDGRNHPQHFKGSAAKDFSVDAGADFDKRTLEEGRALYGQYIRIAKEKAIAENAAWYAWYAIWHHAMFQSIWDEAGAFVHQVLIWAKSRAVLTRSVYMWAHEPCLFGWVRGNKPPVYARDLENSTVWNVPSTEVEKTEHPTSKPVRLFAVPMRLHTTEGQVCYEPFSGSGSQIIAAEQLGRRCFAMEIEPRYVDVAVKRWENLTGLKAIRTKSDGTAWPSTDPDNHPERQRKLASEQEPPRAQADPRPPPLPEVADGCRQE